MSNSTQPKQSPIKYNVIIDLETHNTFTKDEYICEAGIVVLDSNYGPLLAKQFETVKSSSIRQLKDYVTIPNRDSLEDIILSINTTITVPEELLPVAATVITTNLPDLTKENTRWFSYGTVFDFPRLEGSKLDELIHYRNVTDIRTIEYCHNLITGSDLKYSSTHHIALLDALEEAEFLKDCLELF